MRKFTIALLGVAVTFVALAGSSAYIAHTHD
jgi:hypothetical protein